ncbi:dTDP-4-dehydrorhamnose 3,5-epimerase family protein [Allonocardiopsis opalescens]|uniref:dTDP-4-dehydrorhamnose 3,5-epimerase n=1 Tax=Allonocardiopsis opalescens TaxID=1144618 RepID=A0A2T0QCV0_9ACTN|nr:dTDP-4-dehydrorhamnose 3,5-epimerase family protein [Allonocardiopsis opalescens]PRY01757.1 dTDP-4-dehydrorhamnose 3,5-epimerase [Allonocardiopsis opalescens]
MDGENTVMRVRQLGLDGSYVFEPKVFPDDRGLFLEVFSQPAFREALGHPLDVAQVNCSTSRRGTIRGIHAVALPGQARYATCVSGAIVDIVVDVRLGSPTFGRYEPVELTEDNRHVLYMGEGVAHGFAPLTDEATVVYLCSNTWNRDTEIRVHPLDPELALPWPDAEPILSAEDRAAPSLREAERLGTLPDYAACQARYAELRASAAAG